MTKYYTQSGEVIRNPDAYARTGAPMYTTRYTESKDINAPTAIYKMNLEGGKKYVGKTTDVDRRMDQHFSGNGSKVTQKFKPKSAKEIDSCPGFFSKELEQYHTEKTIEKLVKQGVNPINAKISILGLTFKENCPDLRNTKIIGIIDKLSHYQCQLMICDDWVDKKRVKEQYGYDLVSLSQIIDQDAIIVAVAHDDFRKLTKNDLKSMLNSNGLLVDVKSIFDKDIFLNDKMKYWRL